MSGVDANAHGRDRLDGERRRLELRDEEATVETAHRAAWSDCPFANATHCPIKLTSRPRMTGSMLATRARARSSMLALVGTDVTRTSAPIASSAFLTPRQSARSVHSAVAPRTGDLQGRHVLRAKRCEVRSGHESTDALSKPKRPWQSTIGDLGAL